MKQLRRLSVALAVVFYLLIQPLGLTADADKDPVEWEGLRLGMSFEETLKALGPRARKAGSQSDNAPEPNGYSTAATKTLAEELLAESKEEGSDIPKDIQKLCRAALKFGKPRRWQHGGNGRPVRRMMGGLVKTHDGLVDIDSPDARAEPIFITGLDPVSKRFIDEFTSAAKELLAFRWDRDRAQHQQDDSFRIKRPEELYVDPIEDGDVMMQPSFSFTPHLSRITLHAVYNTVQRDQPDTLKVYEAICKRMIKEYGEPASATLSETGRQRVWRFPKTVVTVRHEKRTSDTLQYIQRAPNQPGYTGIASSTTMNVYITYETTESADTQDTLNRDEKLLTGEALRSLDRRFVLQLQADGDLVLSRAASTEKKWSAGTKGSDATTLMLREDGNLVLQTAAGKEVWSSNTAGRDVTHLILQNDGNLVIYNKGAAVWATRTEE